MMEGSRMSGGDDGLLSRVSELCLADQGADERFPSDLKYFKLQRELNFRLEQLGRWRLELALVNPEHLIEIDELISAYSTLLNLKSFNPVSVQLLRNISNTMICLKRPTPASLTYQVVQHPRFLPCSPNLSILANAHSIYIDSFSSIITDIRLLRDNSTVIICSFDKTIRIWNVVNGKQLIILYGHQGHIERLELTKDENFLLSASHDNSVFVWDLRVYQKVCELKWHGKVVFDVILTSDEQFVVSGDQSGSVIVGCWEGFVGKLKGGKMEDIELYCRFEHGSKVRCLASSKDGKSIFSAGLGKDIKVWDLQTKMLKSVLSGHRSIIYDLKVLSKTNHLLSTGQDCTVVVWDLDKMCMLDTIKTSHFEYINSICINHDETIAIIAGKSQFYSVIDIGNRRILSKVDIARGYINAIALRNNTELILCEDSVIGLNLTTKETTFKIKGNFKARILALKVSHYEKYFMGYFKDKTVKFWSLDNGEVSFTYTLPTNALSVSHTPNYKYLLYSPDLLSLSVLRISFNPQ